MENGTTQEFRFEAGREHTGERLDRFLAARVPFSRSWLQQEIRKGHVTVNQEPARPGRRLAPGDVVAGGIAPSTREPLAPEEQSLTFLYRDEWFGVIDKPAGMPVHPSAGRRTGTLVNALLGLGISLFTPEGDKDRAGIVHRLDRDTTGALIVAFDQAAGKALQAQFRGRTVKKEYMAVVHGVVEFDEGEVDQPLGKDPRRFDRRAVVGEGGREARTVYRVVERFKRHTLVRAMPETGRTHQIRLHLQHMGHAVVGDELYLPLRRTPGPPPIERHALHAARLAFSHPRTEEEICCETPLPSDMARLLETLRG
jgi:23S rRNA pseudouridine1911/1915/1917 synthase